MAGAIRIQRRNNIKIDILRSLNTTTRKRILDVGCGIPSNFDVYLRLAKSNRHKFYCVDPDKNSILSLRNAIKSANAGNLILTKLGACEKLNFPAGYFDIILMLNVYAHLNDPSKAFRQISRVLKPGGVLILNDLYHRYNINGHNYNHRYNIIEGVLKHFGFKIVKFICKNKKYKQTWSIKAVKPKKIDILENIMNNPLTYGKVKKTIIITGYACNNDCRFCGSGNGSLRKTTDLIICEIARARKSGSVNLEFSGGEPTIRNDIMYLIKAARAMGYETVSLVTNGRMLSDENFTKNLIDSGVTDIIFSIHGHNGKIHDYLTQAEGSFAQLLAGIYNVKALGFKNIGTKTVIVKQNYKLLPEIGRFVSNLKIKSSEFIFVNPNYGGAYLYFEDLVPKISYAAPYIKKCLYYGKGISGDWFIRDVPLCYFNECEDRVRELYEAEHFDIDCLSLNFNKGGEDNPGIETSKIRPSRCNGCKKYNVCEGIWMGYYKRYGDAELLPIRR